MTYCQITVLNEIFVEYRKFLLWLTGKLDILIFFNST